MEEKIYRANKVIQFGMEINPDDIGKEAIGIFQMEKKEGETEPAKLNCGIFKITSIKLPPNCIGVSPYNEFIENKEIQQEGITFLTPIGKLG